MYQTPAQQPGVHTSPNQQPVSYPQHQGPPGQPQPVFTGQTAMGQQGQPVQPVQGHGVPAPPPLNQEGAIRIDKAYLKSGLGFTRIGEFGILLIAWICVDAYSNRIFGMDGRANFFRVITIFCWVMVTIFEIMFLLGINKNKRVGRPSNFTLVSLGIQVVLTILLIACSTSFAIRFVDLLKLEAVRNSYGQSTTVTSNKALVFSSSCAGLLTCLSFLEDIYLLSKMYRQQIAKEIAAAGVAQQPGTSPQQPGTYPQQPGTYPQQPGTYPQQPGTYPQQPGTYPQQPGTYPQQPGTYPQQPGTYPQQPGTYSQQQAGAVAQPTPGLTQL